MRVVFSYYTDSILPEMFQCILKQVLDFDSFYLQFMFDEISLESYKIKSIISNQ